MVAAAPMPTPDGARACEYCGGPLPAKAPAAQRFCGVPCAQKGKTRRGCHPLGRRWTADEDAELRRLYDGRTETISRLAQRLGRKRTSVVGRAAILGLTRGRRHPHRWSPEMDERLASMLPRSSWRAMAQRLGRTETACRVRAKRLGLHRTGYAFSAWAAAEVLGCDRHKVVRWIEAGLLAAKRTSDVAKSPYRIEHAALRRFVLTYPDEIDLRRVETSGFKATFLDIVARDNGAGELGLKDLTRGEDADRPTARESEPTDNDEGDLA